MRIAYLSTNYPIPSHTFIQGEIAEIERLGIQVLPIALNRVGEDDVLSDLDRREAARTYYLKATAPAEILAGVLRVAARHPLAFSRVLGRALSDAPAGLRARTIRLAQFVEGLLVWRHCEEHGASAVHAHFGQAPASVASFAVAFGNAVGRKRWTWSVTIHGWHEFAAEVESGLRAKFASADLVVCVSDFTRAQVLRLTPVEDWAKVALVRCGIDAERFSARPYREPAATPKVVVVARLSPEKGHIVLLEAMRRLRRDGCDVSACFIGEGSFRPELEKAAARIGVADAVTFAGAQPPEAVAATLREADVFCLPSYAEGLPVSIMEAMAVGVPVATTYVSGTPELVVDGETGWIVPAGNVELLANALRSALSSPSRRAVVDAGRAAVAARHDRGRNCAELAAHLRRCHGPTPRPGEQRFS